MGFTDAIKSFYQRYFDFESRSSRSEYWWVQLFYVLVLIVFGIPLVMSGALDSNGDFGALGGFAAIVLGLFVLAGIIPMIAVTVRRFHDQDKSGWFYLFNFIPYVGGIIIIVFMCLRGTDGENRFGHDPLGGYYGDTFD